jgi:hypothetical protein
MLAPIVLAYVGKQFAPKNSGAQAQAAPSGGIGDVLGGLLGGRGQSGQNQSGAQGALRLPLDLNQGRAMIGPMRLPLVLTPLY